MEKLLVLFSYDHAIVLAVSGQNIEKELSKNPYNFHDILNGVGLAHNDPKVGLWIWEGNPEYCENWDDLGMDMLPRPGSEYLEFDKKGIWRELSFTEQDTISEYFSSYYDSNKDLKNFFKVYEENLKAQKEVDEAQNESNEFDLWVLNNRLFLKKHYPNHWILLRPDYTTGQIVFASAHNNEFDEALIRITGDLSNEER